MKLIFEWFISAVAIGVTSYILPGVSVANFITLLVLAVVLGVINTFVKPIVVALTLPLTVVTLGLFLLVINTALILLAGSIVPGFVVNGFWWAFLFSIILSLVNGLFGGLKGK